MSLFDRLGSKQPAPQRGPMNPMQMMQQLQSNPASFLKQSGFNVPDGMTNPQQITQHLMQTGQVSNNRYQQAVRMLNSMSRK